MVPPFCSKVLSCRLVDILALILLAAVCLHFYCIALFPFQGDPRNIIWASTACQQTLVYAVLRVLNTPDYTLILGMPGTGKTSTIVQAIKSLVVQGKSVLLSSYTNSAVDTVLAKLIQEGVQFLRLGRKEAVHPLVQEWVLGGPQYSDTSVQGLRQLSQSAQVVCCILLS